MNSSVTAGRIVHTTSSVWLPCENFTGSRIRAAVVLPHEVKQRAFGGDEDDAREPEDEHEQLVDHAAVFGNVLREPMVDSTAQATNVSTPKIGTIRNTKAQKRFTTNSTSIASLRSRLLDPYSHPTPTFTHRFRIDRPLLRLAGRLERQRLDVVDNLPNFLLRQRALRALRRGTAGRHRRAGDAGRDAPEQIDRPPAAAVTCLRASCAGSRCAAAASDAINSLSLVVFLLAPRDLLLQLFDVVALRLGQILLSAIRSASTLSFVALMNSLFALLQLS